MKNLILCFAAALVTIGTCDSAHAVVRYRLPLAANTTTHYYYDHNTSSGVRDFKCGSETYNGHRGSDFSGGPRGKTVYAAHSGTVNLKLDGYGDGYIGSSAGGGAGNYVKLYHGENMYTVYMHLNKGSVTTKSTGSSVACSEKIGGVGTSGNSSGLHLHFDARTDSTTRADPYAGCAGGPVSYWVSQAYNSETVSTACQNAAPATPSGLTASVVSSSQINIAWTDNSSNESGFKIERGNGTSWSQIATVGANVRTYSSTGLASGTKYFYRVRAFNASGNSGYSGSASATTKDVIPAAPTSLTATAVSDVQINLGWAQAMANEDGFRVYRSTDGTNYTLVATVGINATSYSNTGLAGNRKYFYKVHAYNTAGNSAASNVASDTTAPQAPTTLVVNTVAGTVNWNKLALSWTDTASSEVGFKIERGTAAAGPFTQIATNAAGVSTYTDSGLAATTTYYYRVRSYNANGNSVYSNVGSRATPNAPPVLGAIGNKTVAAGSPLAFTATASDPNALVTTTTWQNFTSFPHGTPNETILFKRPSNSTSTSGFLDTSTNYTHVFTNGPSAWGAGNKALKAGWGFKTGFSQVWVRLNTFNTATNPNPAIALDQRLQFKFYGAHTYNVGLGVRETGTTAAYGANGGTTGAIEWIGVTNSIGGVPIPNRTVPINTPTTLVFNLPFEPAWAFTGDGVIPQNNVKGVLEHVIIQSTSAGASGGNSAWFDDFQVVQAYNNAFTLDAGAPAGASVGYRTGKFVWTPTAGQVGVHTITVRVTDRLGGQDFETIQVTVTGTGNAAPVLAAIGNKTANEGLALAFTASATDANGNTLTYSLDAGNPSGSSINASSGAFTWTPSEAQGPGSYPITVRVTDNGSPSSNDFETITVAVNEVNVAPVLAAIANQTVNEGQTLTLTASSSDADLPANSITYTLEGPSGMTINASSGAISWTPGEGDGFDSHQVTVTARDNGIPSLFSSRAFTVTVNEVNAAPVLAVGTTFTTADTFADFENFEDSFTGTVLFRHPLFSSTTTNFVETTSNYTTVVGAFPDGNLSAKALHATWSFKTGTTNPWLRLTTFNSSGGTYYIPNPTIDITKRLRFDIWTDKSIKLAVGVRETGTTADIGMDGGSSGTLEWVGATLNGSSPNPSRVIAASNWTSVELNFSLETITAFPGSGNGVLSSATGKAVMEHFAIVPNGGMGAYNVYFDNFQVVGISSNLVVKTGETLTLTNSATDVDLDASTGSKNGLVFTLDAGAPADAAVDPDTGVFTWTPTPAQSPSTNVITIRVTDDGVPALSDAKNITVVVNKANTAPIMGATSDTEFVPAGEMVEYQPTAVDNDVPADTLTYSLVGTVPSGATINSVSGYFSWTPPPGNSTNIITIRVTDNGTPPLYDEMDLTVIVGPTNTAPVIALGTARVTEPIIKFETFTNGTPNEQVLFKKPANSSTTTNFVDTVATNYTTVTTSFPAGAPNPGAKVLRATWTFKTGVTDYWVRLTTGNTTLLPNPTINASARLKLDVYSDKTLKVCLGVRETGTAAENGANGGTTGTIEWVGATGVTSGCPQATRTVNANTWTTLEFDLPNDPKAAFTGDAALNGGQQVLEHLALIGAGGAGVYNVYLDNFEVVTTAALPSTVSMKANSTLTLTATSTDAENNARTYSIEEGLPATSTINGSTGAFSWTPGSGDVGSTNEITIVVKDTPSNGAPSKQDSETFSVIVNADALAPQADDGVLVRGGDSVALSWVSVVGENYLIQVKQAGVWVDVQNVNATDSLSSVVVNGNNGDSYFRVVEANPVGE